MYVITQFMKLILERRDRKPVTKETIEAAYRFLELAHQDAPSTKDEPARLTGEEQP